MSKIALFGTIIALCFVCTVFIIQYLEERKKNKEIKKINELKEKVKKEKEQTLEQIKTGDNKSDFDNSINILHNYSNRRK